MKPYKFEKADFLLSAPSYSEFPKLRWDEMAVAGKSNVGKSSLINHLLRQKKLTKVSGTPGKTQLLNLFLIDESLLLVDLPGYGYAKVPRAIKRGWSETIDQYLNKSTKLKLILFLIDSRHLPSKEDLQFFEWLGHSQVPFIVVFTKTDKLKKSQLQKQVNEIKKSLLEKNSNLNYPEVCYSVNEKNTRTALIHKINEVLI